LAEEWEGRAEWGPTIVLPTCARTREGRRDGGIIVNDGMTSRGGVPTVTREDREMEADIEDYIDACRRVVIDRTEPGVKRARRHVISVGSKRPRSSSMGRGAGGSTIGARPGRCHYRAGPFGVRAATEREELG
jgi:hypothetical protein